MESNVMFINGKKNSEHQILKDMAKRPNVFLNYLFQCFLKESDKKYCYFVSNSGFTNCRAKSFFFRNCKVKNGVT